MPKNEKNTENLVRNRLRANGYFDENNTLIIEEQRSNNATIKRLLKDASKTGKGGVGAPEFIISDFEASDILLIIECKADNRYHRSKECDSCFAGEAISIENHAKRLHRIASFASDGVLHYARKLSKEFTVLAVAVSGEIDEKIEISTFIHTKGMDEPKYLITKGGSKVNQIIAWDDLIEHATFDPTVRRLRFDELMAFSRELHDFMRDHAKLTESEKPLLVSGTLLALQDKAFAKSFGEYKPQELASEWMRVVAKILEKAEIPFSKVTNVTQPYSGIAVHPELQKPTKLYPKGVMHELIRLLNEKVWPFINQYHDFDVVGQFYGEFLKYTGGDKKALGIVLTPRHIVELFALLANVNKDSRVLDICAGTGGFLIGAMHRMMRDALTTQDRNNIKDTGLIGAEQLPNMYALAASNMILRGDGKANLYQGSCFDDAISAALKSKKCSVGMVNPPYSQRDEDLHELLFVNQLLNLLEEGATGIAIVPMGCAIAPHAAKQLLLRNHTLEAVMSMPDELFYPVGTVTCIMVLTAHKSHAQSDRATWFGYWKNDGLTKTKNRGRVDIDGEWPRIRDEWTEAFRNRNDVPGLSVKTKVDALDEWCAEAYMQTDYVKALTREAYEREVKKFLAFHLVNEAEEKALTRINSDDESDAEEEML